MIVLDNDVANAIQAERRAQAGRERVATTMRATARQQTTANTPWRSTLDWLRGSMPTWPRGTRYASNQTVSKPT
jgi:hypothetical protein